MIISITYLPNDFSMYDASSIPARGIIPGSLNAVLNSITITNINNQPPTMGTAIDNSLQR